MVYLLIKSVSKFQLLLLPVKLVLVELLPMVSSITTHDKVGAWEPAGCGSPLC